MKLTLKEWWWLTVGLVEKPVGYMYWKGYRCKYYMRLWVSVQMILKKNGFEPLERVQESVFPTDQLFAHSMNSIFFLGYVASE